MHLNYVKKTMFYSLLMKFKLGLARTGKMFACEWEDVDPDMYHLRKSTRRRGVPDFLCGCK